MLRVALWVARLTGTGSPVPGPGAVDVAGADAEPAAGPEAGQGGAAGVPGQAGDGAGGDAGGGDALVAD